MKKIILVLFGLMLTSIAFSQEAYVEIFDRVSLIQTNRWKISDNRCFTANGEIYVLAYEPFEENPNRNIRDKDLYLYRKDTTSVIGWVKASLVIRHDYFHWNNGFPESLRILDAHINRNDKQSYGKFKVESNGIVTIELETIVWEKGDREPHAILEDLTLLPRGKDFNFILKLK